jgi:hypothetical protein
LPFLRNPEVAMRPLSSLLGVMFLTAGVLAVAALAKGPARPAPSPSPAGDNPALAHGVPRLSALPAPSFHARFSLN